MKKHQLGREDANHEIGNNNPRCYVSFLPTVLLLEILFKLPISVIISCKSVCKEWYNLLSESDFTAFYSTKNMKFFSHFILPVTSRVRSPHVNCRLLCLLQVSNDGNNNSCIRKLIKPKLGHLFRTPKSPGAFRLIGSSNGLLCIRLRKPKIDKLYVCNPLNGDYIQLPPHDEPRYGVYDPAVYKFGYVPSTSNFKVLRILTSRGAGAKVCTCEILTVGVDERWRSLTIPFEKLYDLQDCVSTNGAFHWIVQVQRGVPYIIGTLDLATETTGQIPNPPDVRMFPNMALRLFNNQLCIVYNSNDYQFIIWRMKEYGNVESWTKDVIDRGWFPYGMRSSVLFPVGGLQRRNLLFARNNDLIECNVVENKCSRMGNVVDVGNGLYGMEAYTPSFSSLEELRTSGRWEE